MKRLSTLLVFMATGLLTTGTPGWAENEKQWTIDDHIAAIQDTLTKAEATRDAVLRDLPAGTRNRDKAEDHFADLVDQITGWKDLAVQAKDGDLDAVYALAEFERDLFRLNLLSPAYLGVSQRTFLDMVHHETARLRMIDRLIASAR